MADNDEGLRQVKMGGAAAHTEKAMRACAEVLSRLLPPTMGFTLFVFDYGDNGHVSFISTAKRPSMLAIVRAWLKAQGGADA